MNNQKAKHLLFMRAKNLDLPLDLQLKRFDNTVLPILTLGSEVWGYKSLDMLERVHTDFLRRMSECRKSTPKYYGIKFRRYSMHTSLFLYVGNLILLCKLCHYIMQIVI